ncbi:Two-component response regulator 24 [Linum perenne]
MKVLVVDDEELTRTTHKALLESLGVAEVELAENGQAAVDLHTNGASFDLIVMDHQMPVMDGVKATRKLRAMGVNIPILGVTEVGDWYEKVEFLRAGLHDCFRKPLVAEHLSKYIKP